MRWLGRAAFLFAVAISVALLPHAQASVIADPRVICESPNPSDCGSLIGAHGCKIATVSLLPPGADVNEDCLESAPDSPQEARAEAEEVAEETAEDAPV